MELEIYKNKYEVLRSYHVKDGEMGFELPVLLNGTMIAFRTAAWPSVWYVGYLKVHPRRMTVHFVREEDVKVKLTDPVFYKELWLLNDMSGFGTYKELHILKQYKEVII